MRRIVGGIDRFVFLLIVAITCTLAQPLNKEKSASSSSQDDFAVEFVFRDLLPDGNSPMKNIGGKKHMKNSSGKSDEGGYYKTYGSDAEGEKGYVRQKYSNGDHGYKTLDTFHKKDGDNYGFEKHTAFGKTGGADRAGRQAESRVYRKKVNRDGDHEGADTVVDTYYADGDDDDKASYTEAEGADGSVESASYTDGGDNEHYTLDDGGDAAHYTEGASDSGNSDGYNEHYSSSGGDEGSYGTHSSYSSGGDGGGFYGGEYF